MKTLLISSLAFLIVALGPATALGKAGVFVQCPGDLDGDAVIDQPVPGRDIVCKHLTAGDGFANMADGKLMYNFGFSDVTGILEDHVMHHGMLSATIPAPTIVLKQGQEFYLTLTNVGMVKRPDLFDPHSVHFHGFPNASAYFDGEPEASFGVNMGSSFTYYYNIQEPGTYMYHCHVEAAEHMQMGMLGNLYVKPAQNDLPPGTLLGSHTHQATDQYVYNDEDGSTRYDVEFPIQISSMDPIFHDGSLEVQPPHFAGMRDTYALLNGRGYPDTMNPAELPNSETGALSQKMNSIIQATRGQKVLLRISNLSVTRYFTIAAMGPQMRVVGMGARLLRGPDPDGGGPLKGKDLSYLTSSVTLGGGQAADVIIDTADLEPGRYPLYTTNLNYLSNDAEDFGGMMTEIVIQ